MSERAREQACRPCGWEQRPRPTDPATVEEASCEKLLGYQRSITRAFTVLITFFFGGCYSVQILFPSEDYIPRQVQTWTKQYRASETSTIPAMERLIQWLPLHLPRQQKITVVHGDFRSVRTGEYLDVKNDGQGT